MDAYAAVKLFLAERPPVRVATVVNQSPQADFADEVHGRIAQACQWFLGLTIETGETVPGMRRWQHGGKNWAADAPEEIHSPVAEAIERLAERLLNAALAKNEARREFERVAA